MTKRRRERREHFICPCCGAEVPAGAVFCRQCGASDESGWGEDDSPDGWSPAEYGSDDDFDYDEFVRREFPEQADAESKRRLRQWALAVLVAIVVIALLGSLHFRW